MTLPSADIQKLILHSIAETEDGFVLFDALDKVVFCNASFAEIWGLAQECAYAMIFADLVLSSYNRKVGIRIETDDVTDWIVKSEQKRRQQHYRTFETDTYDGRWFLVSEQVLPDGHLSVYFSDITQKKQNEQELTRLTAELFELANVDVLTKICNRRHFYERAQVELDRCHRNGLNSALLMIDLDLFKGVNDHYGHMGGDRALRTFASEVLKLLRAYDVFGRIGGEEFAVFLPETKIHRALGIAERIRSGIESLSIPFADESIEITVSIGVAAVSSVQLSLDEVIVRADEYLYSAKHSGRNCVRHADSDVSTPRSELDFQS